MWLGLFVDAEPFSHLRVKEAFAGTVGLDPLAVDDELWDGSLADALDDLVGGARSGFDVDFFVRDVVLGQEALRKAAVRAPEGAIDDQFRRLEV